MSPRKIIFIAVASVLWLLILYGAWKLSHSEAKKEEILTGNLSVWILWDTTEWYEKLREWFSLFAPEYKNVTIEFRKFSDYKSYQKILLSALADQKWPDIFMVEAGTDSILEEKLEPIPSEYIDIADFEKRFEDIFLPLVVEWSGSDSMITKSLKGVPLGYETLGMFYNKSLLINTPKTWNEVSLMYGDTSRWDIYPIGIWLSPRYSSTATDTLSLFLVQDGISGYTNIGEGISALGEYLSYGDVPLQQEWSEETPAKSLWEEENRLSEENLTIVDMFIRGEIAAIIGYPSTIKDIEDAKKRAWVNATTSLIFTERVPQKTLDGTFKNLARYKYLGLSKTSKNPILGARFLNYLISEDAGSRFMGAFPTYIPAQRTLYETRSESPLSSVFARTRLESFIPRIGDTLTVFDYGNREEFERILVDNIDRNKKIDKNNIIKLLSSAIKCSLSGLSEYDTTDSCKEE